MKKRTVYKAGFTMVEVIVVAVIVAILAAIAIPSYNGFIRDSRQEAVNNLAETAGAAADIFYRKTNTDPDISDLNLRYDPAKFNIYFSGSNVAVNMVGHTGITKSVPYK
jgi:prepilin-type N-terminal cleavage/methylation domain-containing protein